MAEDNSESKRQRQLRKQRVSSKILTHERTQDNNLGSDVDNDMPPHVHVNKTLDFLNWRGAEIEILEEKRENVEELLKELIGIDEVLKSHKSGTEVDIARNRKRELQSLLIEARTVAQLAQTVVMVMDEEYRKLICDD